MRHQAINMLENEEEAALQGSPFEISLIAAASRCKSDWAR